MELGINITFSSNNQDSEFTYVPRPSIIKLKCDNLIDVTKLDLIQKHKIKKPDTRKKRVKHKRAKAYKMRNRIESLASSLEEDYGNDVFLLIVSKRGKLHGHISKRYRNHYQPDIKMLHNRTVELSSMNKQGLKEREERPGSKYTTKLVNMITNPDP